jgi:hypothetical protein
MVKLTVVPVIPLALSEAMKTATLTNVRPKAWLPLPTTSNSHQVKQRSEAGSIRLPTSMELIPNMSEDDHIKDFLRSLLPERKNNEFVADVSATNCPSPFDRSLPNCFRFSLQAKRVKLLERQCNQQLHAPIDLLRNLPERLANCAFISPQFLTDRARTSGRR